MKKLSCAVLGYGNRGEIYAKYATTCPDELSVIAAIDHSDFRLSLAKAAHGIADNMLFKSLDDFIASGVRCDFVINGTMDQSHYETSIKLLESGFDILLEKPVTGNPDELLHIERLAREKGRRVVVCHVLRYTPFYSEIKKILDSGELGRIMNMQLNEHVGIAHFVKAYVRGKWHSEAECGSGLLLAKCCHDTDLMCWLNNSTEPYLVSSFGERAHFCEENAPDGATQFCYQCPKKDECMFDAIKCEIEFDTIPDYTWCRINKPYEQITREEKVEYLKHDIYGQCVYKIKDMDIVDRQSVVLQYKNGSVATLNLVGGTMNAGRRIHILCEKGEILGSIGENTFTVRKFVGGIGERKETVVDLNEIAKLDGDENKNSITGHFGGDYYTMRDVVRYMAGEATSPSTTVLADSINSHLVCYGAEKSRRERCVINLDDEFKGR